MYRLGVDAGDVDTSPTLITSAAFTALMLEMAAGTKSPEWGDWFRISDGVLANRVFGWNGESFGGFAAGHRAVLRADHSHISERGWGRDGCGPGDDHDAALRHAQEQQAALDDGLGVCEFRGDEDYLCPLRRYAHCLTVIHNHCRYEDPDRDREC